MLPTVGKKSQHLAPTKFLTISLNLVTLLRAHKDMAIEKMYMVEATEEIPIQEKMKGLVQEMVFQEEEIEMDHQTDFLQSTSEVEILEEEKTSASEETNIEVSITMKTAQVEMAMLMVMPEKLKEILAPYKDLEEEKEKDLKDKAILIVTAMDLDLDSGIDMDLDWMEDKEVV